MVVTIRSCETSEASWLRNIARRCGVFRPSFLPAALLRMVFPLRAGARAAARHAEGEAEPRQQLLQLLERLLAEVLDLEDLVLRLRDEIADRLDAGVLEAVRRAHRE